MIHRWSRRWRFTLLRTGSSASWSERWKTTLFKMIVGEELPDAGMIRIGETVSISYVDQNRARIDAKKNVWEAISDGETFIRVGNVEFPSRAYVAAFGFKGADQQKPAG